MLQPDRLSERMAARKLSQSELARRVGVTQATIHKLLTGANYGSTRLHLIARELETTPAYLTGETDDPDVGAPPPPAAPRLQLVTMPVALPTEDALADGFEAVLTGSEELTRGELARELARRLPTLLRIAGGALAVQPSAPSAARAEDPAVPAPARRARQRA